MLCPAKMFYPEATINQQSFTDLTGMAIYERIDCCTFGCCSVCQQTLQKDWTDQLKTRISLLRAGISRFKHELLCGICSSF